MKYQFTIKAFIQDLAKSNMPDNLIISTMKSNWVYDIVDKIYEFNSEDDYIIDSEYCIIIWKDWCIPYKE